MHAAAESFSWHANPYHSVDWLFKKLLGGNSKLDKTRSDIFLFFGHRFRDVLTAILRIIAREPFYLPGVTRKERVTAAKQQSPRYALAQRLLEDMHLLHLTGTWSTPYYARFEHRLAHQQDRVAWQRRLIPPHEPVAPEVGNEHTCSTTLFYNDEYDEDRLDSARLSEDGVPAHFAT